MFIFFKKRKNLHYFLKRYKISLAIKIFGFHSICYIFEMILKYISNYSKYVLEFLNLKLMKLNNIKFNSKIVFI